MYTKRGLSPINIDLKTIEVMTNNRERRRCIIKSAVEVWQQKHYQHRADLNRQRKSRGPTETTDLHECPKFKRNIWINIRQLHCGLKIWILSSRDEEYVTRSLLSFVNYCLHHKIHTIAQLCNILHVHMNTVYWNYYILHILQSEYLTVIKI